MVAVTREVTPEATLAVLEETLEETLAVVPETMVVSYHIPMALHMKYGWASRLVV